MRKQQIRTLFALACVALIVASLPAAADRMGMETGLERSFDLSAGKLTVDVGDADVEIAAGSSRRVDVRVLYGGADMESARERFESMRFEAELNGDEVTVRSTRRKRGGWQVGWNRSRFDVRVIVELPEGFDVNAATGDGDVGVSDLRGELRVATGDGDIDIESVESGEIGLATGDGDIGIDDTRADHLTVRTGDGDIEAARLDAAELHVRTGDGDVSLRDVSGGLDIESGDGDISVSFLRLENSSFATSDGDISIQAEGGADLDLRGEDVTIRGTFHGEKKDNYARGTIDGGGPTVLARTGDGTISFRGSR